MKAVAFFTIAMASSLPAPSAAAASPAKITVAAMVESCVNTLVFTFNLRIGWLGQAGKPTPEKSHKRGNHPLRLPFPWAGNSRFWRPKTLIQEERPLGRVSKDGLMVR